MSETPIIAVLAAGKAARFGGGKLDADCAGQPLGTWILDAVEAAGATPGIIVTASPPPLFVQQAVARGWALVTNGQAEGGLGTSVATAARYATEVAAPALIILLADMPLVTPVMVAALLAEDSPIIATRHKGGQLGVPARFPNTLFGRISSLTGDTGAMAVLRSAAALDVHIIEPQDDALFDVDDREALRYAAAILERRRGISHHISAGRS